MNWKYNQPVTIFFGSGKTNELNAILTGMKLKNGLLISDPIFIGNGMADKILEHSGGLLKMVFSNITPNPMVENVDECASVIRDNGIEFVVALGGGSSLDCAKAAASCAVTPWSITEFHSGKRKFGTEHLPLVAIPTTAGTGSEVTSVSVLTDPQRGVKAPLVCDNFFPAAAIIDPSLTLTVPEKVTASTGMDVLSHALEGFWSKGHQPICDAMALHAARLVFEYLPRAYRNGADIEAKEKMCEASVVAGMAFGLPKTAGSHACSFPLTNIYHIPHGEACAFTLDSFARINAGAEGGRVNEFARQLGFADADAMADRILEMKKDMKLIVKLGDAGIKEEEIESLAEMSKHPNMLNNPVEMTHEKIVEMYKKLA